MELELEGVKVKVYESGEIYRLQIYVNGTTKWKLMTGTLVGLERARYYRVEFKKIRFFNHRVVYKAFNPNWDIYDISQQIDHINKDKQDNRICNLRIVNNAENSQNTNSKGYSWCKKDKIWRARIRLHGKDYSKRCKTEEEAIQEVHELKLKHFPFYERTAIPEGE